MVRRFGLAVALAIAASLSAAASEPAPSVVVDVPYVSQSEDLCGGAAAAMVMRYWGARAIGPSAFASLVDPKAHGIPADVLAAAMTARGWRAYTMRGTAPVARRHLAAGRPVIAMIQVAPGRLHYVVVVAWTSSVVVFHDPALVPFRRMATDAFERAWGATGHLMLLVLPPEGGVRTARGLEDEVAPPASCAADVRRGLSLARERRLDAADAALQAALAGCPESSVPLTELAGVQLLRGDYPAAAAAAREATGLDPDDTHGWRTLATALFLEHQPDAALDAWNRAGEPVLDLARVGGLSRTEERAVERTLGLELGAMLSREDLALARRRLEDVPAFSASRLDYVPIGNGRAEVRAAVVESSLLPSDRFDAAAVALHAVLDREAAWTFSSPTRHGETITAAYRWWTDRPRVALSAAIPVSGAVHGVLTLDGFNGRETFALPVSAQDASDRAVEDRRGADLGFGAWARPWMRWTVTAGIDRWGGTGTFGHVGAAVDLRGFADRAALGIRADAWPGAGGFDSLSVDVDWRSRADDSAASVQVGVDGAIASATTPRGLWPGADTGLVRDLLLRAHPMLDGNVVRSEAFGRQLVHATGEWHSRAASVRTLRVSGAVFLDTAQAWQGDFTRDRTLVDIGAGLRVRVSGRGAVRLDMAHGLTDHANAVSMGWVLPWPR